MEYTYSMNEELNKVTRVEVIDNVQGRILTHYGVTDISIQDEGRTIKVFVDSTKPVPPVMTGIREWYEKLKTALKPNHAV
jgi:hypothetical protein